MTITCVSLRASNTGMILSVSTIVNTCCHHDEQTLPGVAASNLLPDFIHSRYAPWIVKHMPAMAISQPRTEKRRMTRPFADKAISCQPFGPWVRLSYCVAAQPHIALGPLKGQSTHMDSRYKLYPWGSNGLHCKAHHLIVCTCVIPKLPFAMRLDASSLPRENVLSLSLIRPKNVSLEPLIPRT